MRTVVWRRQSLGTRTRRACERRAQHMQHRRARTQRNPLEARSETPQPRAHVQMICAVGKSAIIASSNLMFSPRQRSTLQISTSRSVACGAMLASRSASFDTARATQRQQDARRTHRHARKPHQDTIRHGKSKTRIHGTQDTHTRHKSATVCKKNLQKKTAKKTN